MFKVKKTELTPTTHQYKIYKNDEQLTYSQVLQLWKTDFDFCLFYNNILTGSDFDAYFWENPPINKSIIHEPYEFVLVNSTTLSRIQPTPKAFSSYFNLNKNGVVHFENLGKDALLVVPSAMAKDTAYPHLAAFVRKAPIKQQQCFWQQVGEQITHRISNHNLWVSTSGLGVYWLHVRLDDRPKYYQYKKYAL